MQYIRIGRFAKWLCVVTVCALATGQLVDLVRRDPQVGHWRTMEDQARYGTARDAVMSRLPRPDHERSVVTSFGLVRVVTWVGGQPGSPVVLLPGHSSGIPMWADNLPSWIGTRTIHALDPVGDAGMSAQTVPMSGPDDQAQWVSEVIAALDIHRAHLVGHSFGAATAAVVATRYPEQVASLALLEPVLVIQRPSATVLLWSGVLALPTPQSWRDHALARIGGTSVEEVRQRTPMSEMIDAASSGYRPAMPTPPRLTDDEWSRLAMPVRVDLGAASTLSGHERAAERIRALLPDATVKVWPGRGHSLPMEEKDALGDELLDFWSQTAG
ncbi:alpha/beta fold hydrolase [Luteococcus sp.]|uniref:alpha/beta fold hydrolase n=1 Tax=Luteococcus sp. TaxID=1969402 RepID=UPI003735826D